MDDRIGKIAYSKAGRDAGRPFVVIEVVNEKNVLLADGDLRRIENPKLKNIKHIKITNSVANEVLAYLVKGEMPENHIIRKNLKQIIKG
ncbi:MAG: RNA-binding protein [Syntrophomonadaceae bacterium]|nr:RNA-binding protein [Syntrophomonadaceae bacterium]